MPLYELNACPNSISDCVSNHASLDHVKLLRYFNLSSTLSTTAETYHQLELLNLGRLGHQLTVGTPVAFFCNRICRSSSFSVFDISM